MQKCSEAGCNNNSWVGISDYCENHTIGKDDEAPRQSQRLRELAGRLATEVIAEANGCYWPCVRTAKTVLGMVLADDEPCEHCHLSPADCHGLTLKQACEKILLKDSQILSLQRELELLRDEVQRLTREVENK